MHRKLFDYLYNNAKPIKKYKNNQTVLKATEQKSNLAFLTVITEGVRQVALF